jgi:hypothetical protein
MGKQDAENWKESKMKRYLLVLGTLLFLTAPLSAQNGLIFSTNLNATEGFAWRLANTGGTWTLSFPDDAIVVDASSPVDPVLKGDLVLLPDFTVTNISTQMTSAGLVATATLTPQGSLSIVDKNGAGTVLVGTLPSDGLLTLGPNFIAYGLQGDDLTITSSKAGYGTIIPGLVADQSRGMTIDLSFSGNDPGADISTIIMGRTGTAEGGLSGQIHSIPVPGAILLGGVGLSLVGWMRRRKAL